MQQIEAGGKTLKLSAEDMSAILNSLSARIDAGTEDVTELPMLGKLYQKLSGKDHPRFTADGKHLWD
jgi:hypothetical protein